MKTYVHNEIYKLTVKEKEPGVDVLTFYELMGGNWVQLGPPESWSRAASLEVIDSFGGAAK